jgi:phospholipid-transporting ATPase
METVGKTFMAASGLQGDRKNHAQALVLLGMDMIRTVAMVRNKTGEQAIFVRVGINSGNVVSGVVGCKKQQFSLFGDCVNTASRMQSCAKLGELRVSSSTRALLKDEVIVTERIESIKVRPEQRR